MPTILDESHIEYVREMALLESFAEAEELCASALVNDAQRDLTIADTEEWIKVRINVSDIIPNSNNELLIVRKNKRRLLRWGMRMRLGLPPISETELEMEVLENATSGQGYNAGYLRLQTGRGSVPGREL